MTILNLMLGKKRGGLEQAALDYAEALRLAGIAALTVVAPDAWLSAPLASAGIAQESLHARGNWDLLAAQRLRMLAKRSNATAILCHGNRAISIALKALKGRIPVIAVAHNYSTRRFAKADACFALTPHLKQHLAASGAQNISIIPNMVRLPEPVPRPAFHEPPILGSMGRFVAIKGFTTFIEALSLLHVRGLPFRAILGGDGEDAAALTALIARYELQEHITLTGWVQNKPAFFAALDIFVLPSHKEAFGLALIEAMSHAVPVISTDANGPREILHHDIDGLLVPKNNPEALADAMQRLLTNPTLAAKLGHEGAKLVAREYTIDAMAQRLKTALATPI